MIYHGMWLHEMWFLRIPQRKDITELSSLEIIQRAVGINKDY
jgi:hypothetical protein